ncbi:cytochrome P450 2D14-like [Physella acuta]|uniref:Cytochrome P450 2u1 n=1 Tax=Physella acuta TaxID=109671 RepID=A0A346FQW4_PHYAT|nr:cytochrome P450 2D14-like [Physella acuta]XP_059161801.1 cytochrome P450 2D14-like [Physella acuta]AXN72712.1 cytochrome P450 2u1 [Physella acuta]
MFTGTDDFTTLLGAVTLLLLTYLWCFRRDPKLPPSPCRPLPFVGHLLLLQKDPRPQFKQWREQCGDLFSVYIGGTMIVVLNGYQLLKETLVQRPDDFSDRPKLFLDEETGIGGLGVVMASGQKWKEQKKVTLQILRNFGLGKNILAEKIQEEISFFADLLASFNGQPVDIKDVTNVSMANIVCSIIFGQRFEYSDARLQRLISGYMATLSDQQSNGVINFIPMLKYIPFDVFKAKRGAKNLQTLLGFLREFVVLKGKTEFNEHNIGNFIAAYTAEMNELKGKNEATNMSEDNLTKIVLDLFIGGSFSMSHTLSWCILYAINFPEYQKKAYEEIHDTVGLDRVPCFKDRPKLAYVTAFIMETQRLSSTVPFALPHTCPRDVYVRGYKIPKGTYIYPNLSSVLHDPNIWGQDVLTFNPQRFLDEDGKLRTREEFVPFSMGRRMCLGEALANMQLFLYLATLLQKFQFLPVDAASPPSMEDVFGFSASPMPYEVRIVERS